jgi:hypothetical protein
MMLRRFSLLWLCVMLASCQSHDEAPAQAPASTATASGDRDTLSQARWQGFGDMRFGMDEPSFRKAWGGELKGGAQVGSDCAMYAPVWAKPPFELTFMLEHGHFVRYDVRGDKETAPGGGKVGMAKADVLALYAGKVKQGANKYDPDASVFRVDGESGAVLIFDIGADGKVKAWRMGVPPQIDYVEGCS